MERFAPDQFSFDGSYLRYTGDDGVQRTITSFKFTSRDVVSFKEFLIGNFTVEEFFSEIDAGVPARKVLEKKGYLSPTILATLEHEGYPQTIEGRDAFVASVSKAAKDRVEQIRGPQTS